MSVSVDLLQSHMSRLSRVGFTGNPNLDLRADLVNFHDYSIEKAASLTEDELYHIMDTFEAIEDGVQTCKCEHCGSVAIYCFSESGSVWDYEFYNCTSCDKLTRVCTNADMYDDYDEEETI